MEQAKLLQCLNIFGRKGSLFAPHGREKGRKKGKRMGEKGGSGGLREAEKIRGRPSAGRKATRGAKEETHGEGPGQRRPGEGKRTSAPRSHAARSGRLIRSVRVYGRHGSRRRAREGRLLGKLFSGMAEASAFHRGGDRLLASKKRGGEEERPPAAGNERCPSSPDHV